MKVYLLRHGETEYNVTKQYTGTLDLPVSEAGLQRLHQADFDIATVYVSSLQRTWQTAQILFPFASQIIIPDLRERCFGDLEGQHYILSDEGSFEKSAKNSEEKNAYISRTCAAFNDIISNALATGTDTVVIVAHGGTQMAVLSQYALPVRPYEAWCGKNGGGFVLNVSTNNVITVVDEICYSN